MAYELEPSGMYPEASDETPNHYETLGIYRGASPDDITRAFRRLSRRYHPDLATGDPVKFGRLSAAYTVLHDPDERELYDAWLTTPAKSNTPQSVNISDNLAPGIHVIETAPVIRPRF